MRPDNRTIEETIAIQDAYKRQAITDDKLKPTQAGIFSRIVTHEQARQAAQNFIDAHFGNSGGKGVLISIPARADNDDILLMDYISQQEARTTDTQVKHSELADRLERENSHVVAAHRELRSDENSSFTPIISVAEWVLILAALRQAPDAQRKLVEAWREYFEATAELAELERNCDTTKRFDRALDRKSAAEEKARAALDGMGEQK